MKCREMGLEPTRYCYHRHLKPARLPIPPLLRTNDILSNVGEMSITFFRLFVSSVRWHFFVFRNSVESFASRRHLLLVECSGMGTETTSATYRRTQTHESQSFSTELLEPKELTANIWHEHPKAPEQKTVASPESRPQTYNKTSVLYNILLMKFHLCA